MKNYTIQVDEKTEKQVVKTLCSIKTKYSSVEGFDITWESDYRDIEVGCDYDSGENSYNSRTFTIKQKVIRVSVTTPIVKVNGFSYIGLLEKSEEGCFIVSNIDGMTTEDPRILKIAGTNITCAHCNTNRKRRYAHVFSDDVTGDLKMIAKPCAKEYFGVSVDKLLNDINSITTICATISKTTDEVVEYFDSFLFSNIVDTLTAMKVYSNDDISVYGRSLYTKLKYNHSDVNVTSTMENHMLKIKLNIGLNRFDYKGFMKFYEEFQPKTAFDHNLKLNLFSLSEKSIKLRVIAVDKYLKATKIKEPRFTSSMFIGCEGDKKTRFTATIISKHTFESVGFNGKPTIMDLVTLDSNGNCIVNYDSSRNLPPVGTTIQFTANIKKQSEYKSVKQTTVNYLKIIKDC